MRRTIAATCGLLAAFVLAGGVAAQAVPTDATSAAAPTEAQRMQWFADAKFGIFIHYGIYAVDGIDESWSFYNGHVSYDHYMQQLKGFTAANYHPQAWADLIRESGARYAVLTTKHHDGVALWDTRQGLNVVKDTPAKRDLVGPFVKALRKDDLKVGLYFSLIDWSYPDYPGFTRTQSRYDAKADPARWKRFVQYYQAQLKDLAQRYNPDLYWFDGDWEHSVAEWHARQDREMLLARNPLAIINSRLAGYGDYATPEQGVPVTRPPQKYWELCLTMNNSWGWQPNDHHFKSANQLIRILADTVGMGGNLLLDIGPRADGTIPAQEADTLRQIGRWTHKHAEAIYATQAGIPKDYYAGSSTLSKDGRTLYLFVDGRPNGPVLVKGLMNHVLHARVVGNGTTLDTQVVGGSYWSKVPGLLYVTVPAAALDPEVTVLALTLDGPVQLFHDEVKPIQSN